MRVAFAEGGSCPELGMDRDWISSVVRALAYEYPDSRFDVFVRKPEDREFLSALEGMPNVFLHSPSGFFSRMSYSVWRGFWLPGQIGACAPDILHVGADRVPQAVRRSVRGLKCAVTVHDLGFLSRRDGFTWLQRHKYSMEVSGACRKADMIVVPDGETAAGMVRYYFIPKNRIAVIPVCGAGETAQGLMSVYRTVLSL